MKHIAYILLLFFGCAFGQVPNLVLNELKAFPTAYGGGSNSTGGRGGKVYLENTLNRNQALTDHGTYYSGGLYAALQLNEPLHIVPDLSGNTDLGVGGTSAQFASVNGGNPSGMPNVHHKTYHGHLAPMGGRTLHGGTFRLGSRFANNMQHLIFRHLRSRPIFNSSGVKGNGTTATDDSYTWAFMFYGGTDIILDHTSASFAYDKAVGSTIDSLVVANGNELRRHTFQRGIAANSATLAYATVNPGKLNFPEDHMGSISWYDYLFIGGHRTPNMGFNGQGEVVNTVIYDNDNRGINSFHDLDLNHINNDIIRPSSADLFGSHVVQNVTTLKPVIYTEGNEYEGYPSFPNANTDNTTIWRDFTDRTIQLAPSFFTSTKQALATIPNQMPVKTVAQTYQELIIDGDVGANRYISDAGIRGIYQDPYDIELLNVVRNRESRTWKLVSEFNLPTIPSNTRPGSYYGTIKGIPQWFVTEHGITSINQVITSWDFGDYTVTNNAGYEAIEMYSAWVAGDFEELLGSNPSTPPSGNRAKRQNSINLINN